MSNYDGKQEYPKVLYHQMADGKMHTRTVKNAAEHSAAGKGWYESPDEAKNPPAAKKDEKKEDPK